MATFKRCDPSVPKMAAAIMQEFETHKPLVEAGVKIDYIFAYGERDEKTDEIISDALTHNGAKALGICRKIGLKDRAKGMGDAEICLDHDYWETIDEPDQRALLDHELHHIVVSKKTDDLGRPKLAMRGHDFEVGWFAVIAKRHGKHSIEQQQASKAMNMLGQYFWPEIAAANGVTLDKVEQAVKQARK